MGWRDDNDFEVHPAADAFPMMPDDELDALAADIKANGVRTPLSFFKEGDQFPGAAGARSIRSSRYDYVAKLRTASFQFGFVVNRGRWGL